MENFKTLFQKVVYIHYEGAIRQAKLEKVLCIKDGYHPFSMTWLIAGCDSTYSTPYPMFYSVEDAEEEKNAIDFQEPTADDVNVCVKDFFIDDWGCIHYWKWNGSKAVEDVLCNTYLLYDGNTFVIGPKDKVPDKMYRTKEECKANNRPVIVTF